MASQSAGDARDDPRLAAVVADLLGRDDISQRRAFGCLAISLPSGMIAMVHPRGLVVRLDAARVDALKSAGIGEDFGNGGRVMKEWAAITPERAEHWSALAGEALDAGLRRSGADRA